MEYPFCVCSHAFHVQCADVWLSKRSIYPICRSAHENEVLEEKGVVVNVNGGAAVVLQEAEGRDEESGRSYLPPAQAPAESVVVDMSIA